ncbi:MAG: regulatory protein [Candidatus Kentron sp. G]|nr:MAG: regulatory protein [Candidatus Kentron sp. G]VFM98718.1 MAG: regulatory protein [Candidatus Kentron sp. G]VFM99645.1 MAG: regulatory protein [Candidatus Kentron sp. G]
MPTDLEIELAVRQKALGLLARREHSVKELSRKLAAKGIRAELAARAVSRLCEDNLLSDARFTEAFVEQRVEGGYGPIRIRHELRERGVGGDLAARYLSRDEAEWLERAVAAREKRFGPARPADLKERARQTRFLLYRGFESEHIRTILG